MTNQERETIKKAFQKSETRDLLKTMRILCGPMRFKILITLKYLGKNGLTVTNLAVILNVSPSRISHQLKILKNSKLVVVKKKNREVWYALADHRLTKYFSDI